jgi:hypothetical protein
MKTSPLQQLKTEFGSKDKLIDKLSGKLERIKDESDSAFKKRLNKVSSSTLLRLHRRVAAEKK